MLLTPNSYVALNIGIGVGIAADAMLATVARARSLNALKPALKWASAIGMTHWLFPMIGFLGGWYLATNPIAKAAVYGLGGLVLLLFVFRVLSERASMNDRGEVSDKTSFWLAVWAVSIDALITGPGKAAATAHWTTAEVILSFPFVGMVVFVLVLTSTVPAIMLHNRIGRSEMRSSRALAIFFVVATWIELLVFVWFAVLSLAEAGAAMQLVTPTYSLVFTCTVGIGLFMMTIMFAKVWRAQAAAARQVLE